LNVDILLMEGTTIQRLNTDLGFPSESDIENELLGIFKTTQGMPLVWCSGQNIDRLVTVFRAAKRANRRIIMDMYTAHILKATGNDRLPQAHWPHVRVFLPYFQMKRIKRLKQFTLAKQYRPYRIFPKDLAAVSSNSVMLFRESMIQDVEEAQCLEGSCVVYSMWDGYLKYERMKPFLKWLDKRGLKLHKCHTSGHASVSDLRRLRNAFGSAVTVPVHCAEPELFAQTFDRVRVHPDNKWWEVN
jgi:ribonuclease J